MSKKEKAPITPLTEEEKEIEKSKYTRKIEIPIYEPSAITPAISDLYDTTKRDELIKEIKNEDLPEDLKLFLLSAAERHTSFNFSKIADFYSHTPLKYKKLFENSALVIIDYDNAIRNGFISFEKEVDESRIDYLENIITDEKLAENKDEITKKKEKRAAEELELLKAKEPKKVDDLETW